MGKLVFYLSFLVFSSAHAVSLQNMFYDEATQIDRIINNPVLESKSVKTLEPIDKFNYYRSDPKDIIDDQFYIRDYFVDSVHFWFNVYTIYSSRNVVLHDKDNLKLVYEVLDFSDLNDSILNKHTRAALQNSFVQEKIGLYRKAFLNLAKSKKPGPVENRIIKAIRNMGWKIPKNRKRRKKMFYNLSENLRAQTGQRNRIQEGITNLGPFKKTIDMYFSKFNVPSELLAIPFLESSFNTKAISKVGATGTWQFMEFIGKHFMKINKSVDQRLNPLTASVSALFLLRQNKKILGSWELAIPAYNSGTKHLVRAKRQLKSKYKNVRLENILEDYDHKHIGFASKNFYSEFLALVHALAYREDFYDTKTNYYDKIVDVYVSKCKVIPHKIYKALKSSKNPKLFNLHFIKSKKTYPKGSLVYSDTKLTSKKYYKLSIDQIYKKYPKNWWRYSKNYKCSSR